MTYYLQAFFLTVLVGNVLAFPFYGLLGSVFGKGQNDKNVDVVLIGVFFIGVVSVVIWLLRNNILDGRTTYGKKAYRVVGFTLFGLFVFAGVNRWMTENAGVPIDMAKDFLMGTCMLAGAKILGRLSTWLRLPGQRGTSL